VNIQITQVTFAVGDNDWTATYDGRQLTLESGSLELSIDWNEDDWVPRAKSLVEALSTWDRKGGA